MNLYHHMHKIWLLTLLEKHGVYKHAATESQLTQSALSQNISNLEKVFGRPLVSRGKSGIELTEFAKMIVTNARPILHMINQLHGHEDELVGLIKIGAYDSLAINFIPKIIPTLNTEFPKARFQIVTGRSEDIKAQVKAGELDFGFIISNGDDLGLENTNIANISLGLYARKFYNDQELEEKITSNGIVSISHHTSQLPSFYQSFLSALPYKLKITTAFSSFDSICKLLLSSDNLGVLPDILARDHHDLIKVWDGADSNHEHQAVLVSRPSVRIEIKKSIATLLMREMNLPGHV